MTGARVHEHALAWVIGRSHDRREQPAKLALEDGPGRLHRLAR